MWVLFYVACVRSVVLSSSAGLLSGYTRTCRSKRAIMPPEAIQRHRRDVNSFSSALYLAGLCMLSGWLWVVLRRMSVFERF